MYYTLLLVFTLAAGVLLGGLVATFSPLRAWVRTRYVARLRRTLRAARGEIQRLTPALQGALALARHRRRENDHLLDQLRRLKSEFSVLALQLDALQRGGLVETAGPVGAPGGARVAEVLERDVHVQPVVGS